jgi:hypothetical protein
MVFGARVAYLMAYLNDMVSTGPCNIQPILVHSRTFIPHTILKRLQVNIYAYLEPSKKMVFGARVSYLIADWNDKVWSGTCNIQSILMHSRTFIPHTISNRLQVNFYAYRMAQQ